MNMKKNILISMVGFLTAIFLIPTIFDRLNIPGFDVVLTAIFGESTPLKSSFVLLFFIAFCVCLVILINKFQIKTEK